MAYMDMVRMDMLHVDTAQAPASLQPMSNDLALTTSAKSLFHLGDAGLDLRRQT